MKSRKAFCFFAIAVMLLAVFGQRAYADGMSLGQVQVLHEGRHLLAINCGRECGRRCSAAGYRERCLQYCGICCKKCQCVPPGTYGNKDACPCYRDLKNTKGRSKCP